MEIKGEDYHVSYNAAIATVTLKGALRLRGITEYNHIMQLLNEAIAQAPNTVTLDLQELQFLNSSGINALSRFVIKVRDQGNSELVVRGSRQIPWQEKSLGNFQRLMPTVRLEWR
ncbi:MAG: hypothetical protein JW953_01115 [Anaerolineae bacterium]|nr:hypothetical protein [Anaerolineae bacterium]